MRWWIKVVGGLRWTTFPVSNLVLFGQQTSGWRWRPTGYNPHAPSLGESRNWSWAQVPEDQLWMRYNSLRTYRKPHQSNYLLSYVYSYHAGFTQWTGDRVSQKRLLPWLIFKKILWDRRGGRHYFPHFTAERAEVQGGSVEVLSVMIWGKIWTSCTKQRLSPFPHFQETFSYLPPSPHIIQQRKTQK